ncbi:hypothetical protein WN944_021996 [Citrus x changshan-huyou]|uniref:Uncharacterized protein n=1 Tax=Citrus x changshan-huyou TaxID=2935761 RepID=A0AAP0N402_9ROSI
MYGGICVAAENKLKGPSDTVGFLSLKKLTLEALCLKICVFHAVGVWNVCVSLVPWKVYIKNEGDVDTFWYIKANEFLAQSNRIEDLTHMSQVWQNWSGSEKPCPHSLVKLRIYPSI